MAGDAPIPGGDARGIQALRGTIQGAVRAGYSLGDTLDLLQGIYNQTGGRWTSLSAQAATQLYSAFNDLELKSQALSHVRGDIAITSRWISYATLARPLTEFSKSPAYAVRYHVTGNLDGAPVDRWKTATYSPGDNLPATVGELSSELADSALDTETETLAGAELEVTDVAIYAI